MIMLNKKMIGENIEITKAMKEYADKKTDKIGRFFDDSEDVFLKINFEVYPKSENKCEINLNAPKLNISAESYTNDMYKSIDEVVSKVERQIKKYLTKTNRKQRFDSIH